MSVRALITAFEHESNVMRGNALINRTGIRCLACASGEYLTTDSAQHRVGKHGLEEQYAL